ncbi:hypothetical protein CPC08DRAFT_753590 [Agrocybe pediades]|nr:hypothetical protein CPC08DRAFT_753590 [Agrocybe pediades]
MTRYHTIPNDILWCIFDELVGPTPPLELSPNRFHPIDLMRNVSQVCRNWRRTALEASAIWGRLIDIAYLCGRRKRWREEIMARSKGAPLRVFGRLELKDDTTHDFLSMIVSTEFQRTRVFCVHITNAKNIDLALWDPIWQQQAPNLLSFEISYYSPGTPFLRGGQPENWPAKVLFANRAPCLRSLTVSYGLYLPPSTSWLNGLTTLRMPSSESLNWILGVLKRTTQLKVLRLDKSERRRDLSSTNDDEIHSGYKIARTNMRSLQELGMSSESLKKSTALLSAMELEEGVLCKAVVQCSDFDPYHHSTSMAPSDYYGSVIPTLVSDLFRKVLSSRAGTEITGLNMTMGLYLNGIKIRAGRQQQSTNAQWHVNYREQSFSFSLVSRTLETIPTLIPDIWESLSKLDMCNISWLHLRIDCQEAWATAPRAHLALRTFLSQLSGLHTLSLGPDYNFEESPKDLCFVHESIRQDPQICATLKTLIFDDWFPSGSTYFTALK